MGKGNTGLFKRNSLWWGLDLSEGIDFLIYLRGSFEPDMVKFCRKSISRNDIILDIGANIGAHTLHFARLVSEGDGRVIAVEATDFAYKKLRKNLSLNEDVAHVVTTLHCMLVESANSSRERSIYASWPLVGSDRKHEQHQGVLKSTGDAAVATLDEVLVELKINRVDWVKIDVDGHELQVIKGATTTLTRFRPNIMMELAYDYDGEESKKDFDELILLLTGYGYHFREISGKSLPSDPEALMGEIPPGSSINAVLSVYD